MAHTKVMLRLHRRGTLGALCSLFTGLPLFRLLLVTTLTSNQPYPAASTNIGNPDSFTCLAPMLEDQALDESEVWLAIMESIGTDQMPVFQSAGETAGEGAHERFRSMPARDQLLLKLVDDKVAAECDAGADVREPLQAAAEVAAGVLKGRRLAALRADPAAFKPPGFSVGKPELAPGAWQHKAVGDLVHSALDTARSQEGKIENVLRPDAPSWSAPLLNVGEACWAPCGNSSGNCSSGFCGGGICCRRWHIDPGCPLVLHGGCVDEYCCVARPPATPVRSRLQPRCDAQPGFYCLAALAKGLEHRNMTAAEFCAMDKTMYMCPPGFYCRGGQDSPRACHRGQLCPVGSSAQLPCPAGSFCPLSIWQERCPKANTCAENASSPQFCPAGSYCVDGIQLICPQGHVCGPGTTTPMPCAYFANCPEGSASQGWDLVAKCSLAVVVPVWVVAVKAVPRWLHPKGGFSGIIPTLVTLGILGAAWVVNLNLVYTVARYLNPTDVNPAHLQIERLFGFAPHATALVFITISYAFLLYGYFVSFPIPDPEARMVLDTGMAVASSLAFIAYMEDWHVLIFALSLAGAFKVVWVMLAQHGTQEYRVGILFGAFVALTFGFVYLQAFALLHLLGITLMVTTSREVLWWSPDLRRLLAKLKSHCGKQSADVPPQQDTLQGGGDTATAVTAAARASLEFFQREPGEDDLRPVYSGRAASSSSWAPPCYEHGKVNLPLGAAANGSNAAHHASGRKRDPRRSIAYELKKVSYCLEGGRKLLRDISFAVPAGDSVAIMGASGAGKTTLLSMLSGRCGDASLQGELLLNGVRVVPWQMAELRPLIGYVPQDDVMHTCLTVRENIEFQAELRLRHAVRADSPEEVGRQLALRIDEVVQGLGLSHVQNRLICSGLSGGQRKRVSIGMEIVSKPQVLLLDEPSSGLDASTAHRILETVLCGANMDHCTSFTTIHQPRWSTLSLFDRLVLLAPGGHMCYAGPVAAAKPYFMAVPRMEFPKDQNPADIIIDSTTFESARMMTMDGTWRNPPQCLRAVLIPTPVMEDEEAQELWQMNEFGSMLAALWSSFAAIQTQMVSGSTPTLGVSDSTASSSATRVGAAASTPMPIPADEDDAEFGIMLRPLNDARQGDGERMAPLELEPPAGVTAQARDLRLYCTVSEARTGDIHWAQQVWMHMARALLVLSRAVWPTIATNNALLMVAMAALALAFPTLGFRHVFLRSALMFLLLCLTQSVAAQRIFGGEEKSVASREASVCSLAQVVFSFVGKDMASLVEMGLSAACFALTYWPLVQTNASGGDVFAIGFACLYCIWGMNHIFAIAFPQHTAVLVAVIISFMSFLFCGVKPHAHELAPAMNGHGALLLLASPIRWALSNWIYRHVTGAGSTYLQPEVKAEANAVFTERGFNMDFLPHQCPDHSSGVLQRWVSRSGWACHTGQLFLLGILFRFLAVTCLLCSSSAKASGGRLSFGAKSTLQACLLRDFLVTFLVFLTFLEVLMLGQTY